MKVLFFLVMMVMPLAANCQTFFADGMTWVTEVYGTTDPEQKSSVEKVTIKGDSIVNGISALKMYGSLDDGEPSLLALIRNDDDKVYFTNDACNGEWMLMYDFGLQKDEGCYVYSLPRYGNPPVRTYVKYVGAYKLDASPEWFYVVLAEYRDDSCADFLGSGGWIEGIGSKGGVLANNCFQLDGFSSRLKEVLLDGEILYTAVQPTAVMPLSTDAMRVRVEGADVYVSNIGNGDTVSLIAENGMLVRRVRVSDNAVHFVVPGKGVYFIKHGREVRKIVV